MGVSAVQGQVEGLGGGGGGGGGGFFWDGGAGTTGTLYCHVASGPMLIC